MRINLKDNDNILILHHWDCDGICSAVLLYKYLKKINNKIKVDFFLPKIGNYFIDDIDRKSIIKKDPNTLFIVDMALPKDDILRLKKDISCIHIFDHHKQDKILEVNHINPFTDNNYSSLDFPSAGWVINDYFNKPQNILSVLGAIGDQEEKVKNNIGVERIIEENGLSFDKCVEITKSIDSCYVLNDIDGIKDNMVFLINNNDNQIIGLINSDRLLGNREKVVKEINMIVNSEQKVLEKEKIIIKEIETDYHIISDITRTLSKKYDSYVIIVINRSSNSMSNIYFRTKINDINLYNVMDLALKKGYKAGGKKEVAGIILPEKEVNKFISIATKLIINSF